MKNILIQISASIATYKICHVISKLTQKGYQVKVAVSPHALQFIGESTLEGLSQNPIHKDTFAPNHAMDHIHLVRWADLIIAAPATANFINKIANGIGDDLLTTQFLAHDFTKPYLIAPAMNTAMYLHPVTQESLQKLRKLNVEILETESGVLACGEVGWGRLLDPDLILEKIDSKFASINKTTPQNKISQNQKLNCGRVLITAGGTQEPIDAMRVISNLSTGKTGTQLAEHLYELGFDVTLLKAKNSYQTKYSQINTIEFQTFNDLQNQLQSQLQQNDFDSVIHAAAVSDFSVSEIIQNEQIYKIPTPSLTNINLSAQIKPDFKIKSDNDVLLKLVPNPKLISQLKNWSKNKNIYIVGFKYTSTMNEQERLTAVEKLFTDNSIHAVVHNDHNEINRAEGSHLFTFFTKENDMNSKNNQSISIHGTNMCATKCSSPSQIFQYLSETLFKKHNLNNSIYEEKK